MYEALSYYETAQGEEEALCCLCSQEEQGDTRTDEARGRRDTRARVIQGLTEQRHASTRLLVSACRLLQGGTRLLVSACRVRKEERDASRNENPSRSNAASFTSSL